MQYTIQVLVMYWFICRKYDIQSMTNIFDIEIRNGETLTQAIERNKRDELERLERERIKKEQEKEKIKLMSEQIKLFKTQMDEYFENSYYDWFKCDSNIYALSIFSDKHYVIYRNVAECCFELYNVDTTNGVNSKHYISEDNNLVNLIEYAQDLATMRYTTYVQRNSMWKKECATPKQIAWLSKEWWAKNKPIKTKMDVHVLTKGNKIQWIIKKKDSKY